MEALENPMAVIIDRDGTLASVQHIAPTTRDGDAWRAYNAALPFDAPVPTIVSLARACYKIGYKVLVVSGRMEGDWPGDRRRRFQLQDWLAKHDIPYHRLSMRAGGDTRLDSVVKAEMYDTLIAPKYLVVAVIDDREQVIEMWRSKGLFVIPVTDPGITPPIAR